MKRTVDDVPEKAKRTITSIQKRKLDCVQEQKIGLHTSCAELKTARGNALARQRPARTVARVKILNIIPKQNLGHHTSFDVNRKGDNAPARATDWKRNEGPRPKRTITRDKNILYP